MIGIDLFAGAGGMSLGATRAGVKIKEVVEIDPHAANTYLKNHDLEGNLLNIDIRKYSPNTFIRRGDEQLIVFGGPPCQGFSTSNQKTRTQKNSKNWLFEEFARVVEECRPEWIVFENVKGILETEGGFFVERIVNRFEKLGYNVSVKLLASHHYGVPQKRTRFFLVGSLNNENFNFPKPAQTPYVTVSDAISDLPSLKNGASECYLPYKNASVSEYSISMRKALTGCSNNLVTKNNELILQRYRYIPQGGNWENIPEHLMENYSNRSRCHTGIYRRLEMDKPSTVIGNFRKNKLIHPHEDRGLSVREAARLQSFPDDYTFSGSIGFQQQQVGNAVPPLLAEKVFREIVRA